MTTYEMKEVQGGGLSMNPQASESTKRTLMHFWRSADVATYGPMPMIALPEVIRGDARSRRDNGGRCWLKPHMSSG